MTSKKYSCRNCKKQISEEEVRAYLKLKDNDFLPGCASVMCRECLVKRSEKIRQANNIVVNRVKLNLDEF